MPFTLYHIGPGLLFGLLFFRFIDLPTFLVSNIILDIEPALVLIFNFQYPLHGFIHTFVGGTLIALILVVVMDKLLPIISPMMSYLKLEQRSSPRNIFFASLFGVYLHIFLDSILYSDIQPFYPFNNNPFLNMLRSTEIVFIFCILSFIGGCIVYTIKQIR